jgi:hypothetical protein
MKWPGQIKIYTENVRARRNRGGRIKHQKVHLYLYSDVIRLKVMNAYVWRV